MGDGINRHPLAKARQSRGEDRGGWQGHEVRSVRGSGLGYLVKGARYYDPTQTWPTTPPSMQEWMWNQTGSFADPKQDFCGCE